MDILTILIIVLLLLAVFLWVWVIYDISKTRTPTSNKLFWLAIILFIPLIGPIIYFQMKRRT